MTCGNIYMRGYMATCTGVFAKVHGIRTFIEQQPLFIVLAKALRHLQSSPRPPTSPSLVFAKPPPLRPPAKTTPHLAVAERFRKNLLAMHLVHAHRPSAAVQFAHTPFKRVAMWQRVLEHGKILQTLHTVPHSLSRQMPPRPFTDFSAATIS